MAFKGLILYSYVFFIHIDIPRPDGGTNAACPNTRVFENMTLKGGVDAGAYKDHGKVKDMTLCRRICCEMTECHLAFLLGTNCFSVKCADVDSCRAQRAKPSAYSPKVGCIVGSIHIQNIFSAFLFDIVFENVCLSLNLYVQQLNITFWRRLKALLDFSVRFFNVIKLLTKTLQTIGSFFS